MAKAAGRPDLSEIAPHAKAYVDLVPDVDILAVLAEQVEKTIALLRPLSEERVTTFTYAPGKWTVKQIERLRTDFCLSSIATGACGRDSAAWF
jgi:hypothetical protein